MTLRSSSYAKNRSGRRLDGRDGGEFPLHLRWAKPWQDAGSGCQGKSSARYRKLMKAKQTGNRSVLFWTYRPVRGETLVYLVPEKPRRSDLLSTVQELAKKLIIKVVISSLNSIAASEIQFQGTEK
jgi:hypothetical protein